MKYAFSGLIGVLALAMGLAVVLPTAAFAGHGLFRAIPLAVTVPIGVVWQEFTYTLVGEPATGCFPADPGGPVCGTSFLGTEFAPAPPWEFEAPGRGAVLTVTDAVSGGDVFEIFDFASSIGTTSVVAVGDNCGSDPVACLANKSISSGFFRMEAGPHSITIEPTASLFPEKQAYFRVERTPEEEAEMFLLNEDEDICPGSPCARVELRIDRFRLEARARGFGLPLDADLNGTRNRFALCVDDAGGDLIFIGDDRVESEDRRGVEDDGQVNIRGEVDVAFPTLLGREVKIVDIGDGAATCAGPVLVLGTVEFRNLR